MQIMENKVNACESKLMADDAADEVMACRLETDAAELGPDGTHTPAKPDYLGTVRLTSSSKEWS